MGQPLIAMSAAEPTAASAVAGVIPAKQDDRGSVVEFLVPNVAKPDPLTKKLKLKGALESPLEWH